MVIIMVNVILLARKVSVILLVTLRIILLTTGFMLETMPEGPGSGKAVAFGLSKETWIDIHRYAGFRSGWNSSSTCIH